MDFDILNHCRESASLLPAILDDLPESLLIAYNPSYQAECEPYSAAIHEAST